MSCKKKTNTLTVDPDNGKVVFDGEERTSSHSAIRNAGATIQVPDASKSKSTQGNGKYKITYKPEG
jgi:hypothetical protein